MCDLWEWHVSGRPTGATVLTRYTTVRGCLCVAGRHMCVCVFPVVCPKYVHYNFVSVPQLLQVYRFAGLAVLQVCYVLITNEAVYILEDSECIVRATSECLCGVWVHCH